MHWLICKRQNCLKTKHVVKCSDCHIICGSNDCFEDHKKIPIHKKGPKKVNRVVLHSVRNDGNALSATKLSIELDHRCGEYLCKCCQQYILRGHQCYLRATPYKQSLNSNFIFFYLECSQDCDDCQLEKKRNSCQNCKSAWCGRTTHRPSYVVAQSICKHCIHINVTPDSTGPLKSFFTSQYFKSFSHFFTLKVYVLPYM